MTRPFQFQYVTDSAVTAMMLAALDTGSVGWVDSVAMRVDSDDNSETYGWLGNVPGLSEFIGGRSVNELKEYSFSVTNKDYESTLRFQRKDMRLDKSGMIETRVGQFAQRVLDHPAKLLSTLIISGESAACYDSQYFFDTDHKDRDETAQSNDIGASAASATAPTAAEMTTAIMKAVQAMYGFTDDQGEPVNQSATQFMVMVPVPFMSAALEAVTAILGTGGASALLPALKGRLDFTVQVNPRLTWTTKFAVFRTDGGVKPFILQTQYDAEPWALGPDSEHCTKTGECWYGVDWGGNVAFGDWRGACLVTLS
ncbi:MAG: Mu-like prophage major head subunit gpT family protein [Hyphomicrobiaceae bacterium]|nr:Mu-like prophage major head subunit gpT family protein [Hyphomicrobiaceae bacterium]